MVVKANEARLIHATGTGNAGGKAFQGLCRLPAAMPDRQKRQKKKEKFALYITENDYIYYIFPSYLAKIGISAKNIAGI